MSYGQQVFVLDFTDFTAGKLAGQLTVVTPNDDRDALRRTHSPRDAAGNTIFVSFDAEAATGQYRGYGEGLVHVLHNPEPSVDGPRAIGREPIEDLRFDYDHDTFADRVIAVVGFPSGWSANHFDPWPTDAKRVGQRLAVKFDLSRPEKVYLKWQLQPLSLERNLAAEVKRIKRGETGADSEKTLVLFIHGLGGEALETWENFPELLQQDDEFARKYLLGFFSYPTMLIRWIFRRKAPSIQELAAGLRTEINNRYGEFGNIVLVCHSLGGVIARKYLLDEVKAKQPLRVKGLVLFAVPNNGADLAAISHLISWRHPQVRQLCRGSDLLEILNEDWFTMGLPEAVRAKYITGTQDRVVDRFSARATWGNPDVETVIGEGHRSLVKPKRATDSAVLILKKFLKTIATSQPPRVPEQPAEPKANAVGTAGLEALLNAQNQPVFEARVQGLVNAAGICDRDYIVLRNAGAPISQLNVSRTSVFSLRYYDMRNAPLTRTISTQGYYNASLPTGNALGDLFSTDETKHRTRMHRLLSRTREERIKGYMVLADFRHFLRISYKDRGEQRQSRTIEVSESGYTDASEAEWDEVQRLSRAAGQFDFDSMTDDQFLQLVQGSIG